MICFAAMWSTNSSIQVFHFTPIGGFNQGVSGRKVTVQSAGSDARLFGNVVQAAIRAKAGKRLLCSFQNELAIALRIRT